VLSIFIVFAICNVKHEGQSFYLPYCLIVLSL